MVGRLVAVAVKALQSNLLYCKQRFQFCMLFTLHICVDGWNATAMKNDGVEVLNECEWSDNDFRTSTLLMHVVGSFPKNRIQLTHINLPHSHQKLHVTNSKFNLSERHYQTLTIPHCALLARERERCRAVNSVNKLSILQWILIKNQKVFC